MKIVFVRPPQTLYKGSQPPIIGLPLGVLHIAAMLKDEVVIIDALLETKVKKNDEIHFGMSWEELEKTIEREKPDVVAITNPFSTQVRNAIKTAKIAKRVRPLKTVIGGPHSSVKPEDFLKNEDVDIVVMGEGEYVFPKIIEAIKRKKSFKGIKGIAYREKDKIKVNPRSIFIKDLDSLPLPAYNLVDMEKYFQANKDFSARPFFDYPGVERAVSVVTSRGCPYNCCFCSVHLHMGRLWRFHSTNYVLRHLKLLVDKYDVKHIHFEDDNISIDKERFGKILDGVKKLGLTWDTPNGIRADTLDRNLLEKVKTSGCTYLIIGIESGDQRVLNEIIGKNLDLKKVEEVAKICKEIRLPLDGFYIIGFPGETKENIMTTIDFALRMNKDYDVYPYLFFATPLLGTRLYKECVRKGFLVREATPENLSTSIQGQGMIATKDFDPEYLKTVANDFRKKWFLYSLKNLSKYSIKRPRVLLNILTRILRNPLRLRETLLQSIRYKYLLGEKR